MDESTLWHARLGHVAHDRLAALNKVAEGVPPDVSPAVSDGPCEGWVCGQMCVSKCARTSESVVTTNSPLEVVRSDLLWRIDVTSKGGTRYIVVFIDDRSRYVQVYLVKQNSKVLEKFTEQLGTRIRCI